MKHCANLVLYVVHIVNPAIHLNEVTKRKQADRESRQTHCKNKTRWTGGGEAKQIFAAFAVDHFRGFTVFTSSWKGKPSREQQK